jgi:hypothetical protein
MFRLFLCYVIPVGICSIITYLLGVFSIDIDPSPYMPVTSVIIPFWIFSGLGIAFGMTLFHSTIQYKTIDLMYLDEESVESLLDGGGIRSSLPMREAPETPPPGAVPEVEYVDEPDAAEPEEPKYRCCHIPLRIAVGNYLLFTLSTMLWGLFTYFQVLIAVIVSSLLLLLSISVLMLSLPCIERKTTLCLLAPLFWSIFVTMVSILNLIG